MVSFVAILTPFDQMDLLLRLQVPEQLQKKAFVGIYLSSTVAILKILLQQSVTITTLV